MKRRIRKIIKSRVFLVLITAIITISISVYATNFPSASSISYDPSYSHVSETNMQTAIDSLYRRAKSMKDSAFCKLISGTKYEIGSKYECTVGYNNTTPIKYNFYLLAIDNNRVRLIQEHNITEGTANTMMTWSNAMKYIDNNNLKGKWTNVLDIDLPMAQDIANAVGNTSWKASDQDQNGWFYLDSNNGTYGQTQVANSTNKSNYAWLYDYTGGCDVNGCNYSFTNAINSNGSREAYGYWTRDVVPLNSDTTYPHLIYSINREGYLIFTPISQDTSHGVRLVITVLKSNLYQ